MRIWTVANSCYCNLTVLSVPETILRKRALYSEAQEKKAASKTEYITRRAELRKEAFKHASSYVKEYRELEKRTVNEKRLAKQEGSFYVPEESKVLLVVRIVGIIGLPPKAKKILQLLRLRQLNNCVFVRSNAATLQMLRIVSPYVAFGYPNLKTVRELVYKRGFAIVNKQRLPITDNIIVEKNLGQYGIICVEDIVHELFTCGKHFSETNRFLYPFQLNSARGGMSNKRRHVVEGGVSGNQEEMINKLVNKMI